MNTLGWGGAEDLRLVIRVVPLTDFSMMAWLDVPEAKTGGSSFRACICVLLDPGLVSRLIMFSRDR
jgi:hypothetical protein